MDDKRREFLQEKKRALQLLRVLRKLEVPGGLEASKGIAKYLAAIGRKGGQSKSWRKVLASRKNGELGGRPQGGGRKS